MADVVYVDDEPDAFMAKATPEQRARIQELTYIRDKGTESLAAPAEALVWLFDFFLVDAAPGNSFDENGLSLFQKWKVTAGGRPTTIVVSSDLEKAVGEPLGPVERHHVIAQRHGVEWIGDKSEETLQRVVALADAAAVISADLKPSTDKETFGTYELDRMIFDVLRAPRDADWVHSAQRQIDRARPPREVPANSQAATARTIVGWMLAHVLPYPSFLLSDAQAALRLQIAPASFQAIADATHDAEGKEHSLNAFAPCQYTGPLSTFLGRRWWRAAIDDIAWQFSQDGEGFRPAFEKFAGGKVVKWLDQSEPVLLFDANLVETEEVAEASDCVRVTDEDFPANVDPAWVLIDAVRRDRLLAAKVVYEDRDILSAVA
jgi:hypothetical protein